MSDEVRDPVTYLQRILGHWPSSAAPDNAHSPCPYLPHSPGLPAELEKVTFLFESKLQSNYCIQENIALSYFCFFCSNCR